MKVSTDSVILGAWSGRYEGNVLDIGCGSGLLSLMIAQKNEYTTIDAVDNQWEAYQCSLNNFQKSPFAERLNVFHADFRDMDSKEYRHIITNPPYFENLTPSAKKSRNSFRHSEGNFWDDFWVTCDRLLMKEGSLEMILPYDRSPERIQHPSIENLFHIHRVLFVKHQINSKAVLMCLTFKKQPSSSVDIVYLPIYREGREWSPSYKRLCEDFYWNL